VRWPGAAPALGLTAGTFVGPSFADDKMHDDFLAKLMIWAKWPGTWISPWNNAKSVFLFVGRLDGRAVCRRADGAAKGRAL